MNRVTLAIIVFFSTAFVLYWQVQQKQGDKIAQGPQIERPDYMATDLNSVAYDEQGNLSSKVTAKHMEHYATRDTTLFTEPVYWLYGEGSDSPWRISAKEGRLKKDDTQKAYLDWDVTLEAIGKKEPIQSVSTRHVELDLDNKTMTTDAMVYIKGNGFQSQGKGLFADFNNETVRLNDQVTGTYEANK
ncbi:LPS export ABC transporter periplasmic protein LptC [Parashewanella curva]|uniref:Lipopolysaccharide export system protein LptC n=1 Tax=Parashewanella curva TaxID=2338552 RepID=A0A3L8PXT4_9GAMM|nr:LPS export ABC transporter periplasmic protein LptC [Parashewanella curva]RLV60267.1 LPS export ABC transporter periplasmic protein LptC [Parashewanella curva]